MELVLIDNSGYGEITRLSVDYIPKVGDKIDLCVEVFCPAEKEDFPHLINDNDGLIKRYNDKIFEVCEVEKKVTLNLLGDSFLVVRAFGNAT